jgi:hypothetical protein
VCDLCTLDFSPNFSPPLLRLQIERHTLFGQIRWCEINSSAQENLRKEVKKTGVLVCGIDGMSFGPLKFTAGPTNIKTGDSTD